MTSSKKFIIRLRQFFTTSSYFHAQHCICSNQKSFQFSYWLICCVFTFIIGRVPIPPPLVILIDFFSSQFKYEYSRISFGCTTKKCKVSRKYVNFTTLLLRRPLLEMSRNINCSQDNRVYVNVTDADLYLVRGYYLGKFVDTLSSLKTQ